MLNFENISFSCPEKNFEIQGLKKAIFEIIEIIIEIIIENNREDNRENNREDKHRDCHRNCHRNCHREISKNIRKVWGIGSYAPPGSIPLKNYYSVDFFHKPLTFRQ